MKKTTFTMIVMMVAGGPAMTQVVWQQTNGPEGGRTTYLSAGPDNSVFALVVNTDEDVDAFYVPVNSADGGSTWQYQEPVAELVSLVGRDSSGAVYVQTENDLLRSQDNGVSWETVLTGMYGRCRLLPASDSVVYIYGDRLWRSTDAGTSWTLIDSTLSNQRMGVNSLGALFREAYAMLFR